MLHFAKNKMQAIQRYKRTVQKERNEFFARSDNRFNTLMYLDDLRDSVIQFIDNNAELCNNYEEFMQNDEDYIFYQRRLDNIDKYR